MTATAARSLRLAVLGALCLQLVVGCTDWDAGNGLISGPRLQIGDSASSVDGSTPDGGYVLWDSGPLDTAELDLVDDAASGSDALADILLADGVEPADQLADSDADDTAQYSFDGKGDFVGWPDTQILPDGGVVPDSVVVPDGSLPDSVIPADVPVGPDATGDTGTAIDTGAGVDSGVPTDTGTAVDSGTVPDAVLPPDAGVDASGDAILVTDNGVVPDAGLPDAIEIDGVVTDVIAPDDAGLDGTVLPDGVITPDGIVLPDGGVIPDSTQEPDNGAANDGYTPDWQGFPDTSFPPDVDIYAGAIGSCLQLYLYQQESCGKNNPTAECIDSVAQDGSLYAQFLYEPLRLCENAVCVPQCQNSNDPECFERCVGKSCAAQFFGCTANAASAGNTCSATFECAQKYEDKFLTISAKCYASATPLAQQQFVSVISCTVEPQTESCVQELATCYGAGPNGTSSCSEVASCAQGCGSSEACVWQCMGSGTPQSIALIDDWWDCLVQVCEPKCGNDQACSDQCGQQECLAPLLACLSD